MAFSAVCRHSQQARDGARGSVFIKCSADVRSLFEYRSHLRATFSTLELVFFIHDLSFLKSLISYGPHYVSFSFDLARGDHYDVFADWHIPQ